MIRFIYSLGIRGYGLLIHLAALFKPKAKLWVVGRKGWRRKLKEANLNNCFWMHCASLGEFEQGRPILEAFKRLYPSTPILLTFFSPSGYEQKKNYHGADLVIYLPLDTKNNAQDFVRLSNPSIVVFVKYEVWHNFFLELKLKKVKTVLISSIFRKEQIYFKTYGGFAMQSLRGLSRIFTQNEQSRDLLKAHGINRVNYAGDTRFDRVSSIIKQPKPIQIPELFFGGNKFLIIGGSTWPEDEKLLLKYLENHPETKLILAPHELHEKHLKNLKSLNNYTEAYSTSSEINSETRIVLIDQMGLLSSLYEYGDIALIGGGFGSGIHNTLEAAAWGKPVLFGPNYQRFDEAMKLIEIGAGASFSNYSELERQLEKLRKDERMLKSKGELARDFVEKNTGATEVIMEGIKNLLAEA